MIILLTRDDANLKMGTVPCKILFNKICEYVKQTQSLVIRKSWQLNLELLILFLKVHYCRFENLLISLPSYENNMPKISHYNTFYFLRCTHMRYVKCFITIIQKQQKIMMCIKTELNNILFFIGKCFALLLLLKQSKESTPCKIYAVHM